MPDDKSSLLAIAKRVLRIEAEAISSLSDKLNTDFENAVDIIFTCSGRVIISGMGKSGLIGKKIAATLASTGTPSFFLHPAEAGHGDLGMVTSHDVIIAISYSGETDEIVSLIPFIKRFNVKLISLAGNPSSTLARSSDVSLDVSVKEEACSLGIVPTSSTTAALAMGDALAVALLTKKGFKTEDFASFHPGGSLGKKLLITVGDLMHTGDSLPLVPPDVPMMQAIMEMSSKRLGLTLVVNQENTLQGIITDGDVRRGIEKWGKSFFDMIARDVMSTKPKTIHSSELAAKALSIMENHSITALVVSDGNENATGIIHLHDILKKGIV